GKFSLENVKENDIISFSILGFATYEYSVTAESFAESINITLNEAAVSLEQVTITPEVNTLSQIVAVDVGTDPVKSSQEILRKVPGLIIGQHAGGGKAEQIFLRGFDVDHGTDVAISVDGLPVNMVSHAHGQGYADLHFVIPETIEKLDLGKAPYYAEPGNFNTAGYVDLRLKRTLDKSVLSTELGQFGTRRFMGMFKLLDSGNSSA